MKPDVVELLLGKGLITVEQAQKAREIARSVRGSVARVLIDLNMAPEKDVREAEAEAE